MNLTTVKTTILIFIILLTSLLWAVKPAQAMRRESNIQPAPVVAVAQAEVRVILIGRGW